MSSLDETSVSTNCWHHYIIDFFVLMRPISDHSITEICYAIGVFSLILNFFCLFLIWKIKQSCTRSVFVVLILLQITYTVQNFHFAVLYIPFIYIKVTGGYCIGLICEPHYISFSTNLIIFLFLTGTLGGLFTLLLFLRHQSLVNETSRVKLGKRRKTAITFTVIASNLLLPIRYSVIHFASCSSDVIQTMQRINQFAEWIANDRNFGAIPMNDASIDGIFVSIISTLVSAFTFACTIHIFQIIYAHNKLRSTMHWKRTVRQTRQTLIQMATFCGFLTAPVALLVSMLIFEFDDDSLVLIPCILLFSLNSMAHSILIIFHSPAVRELFSKRFRSESTCTLSKSHYHLSVDLHTLSTMSKERPISDRMIRIVCESVGTISLFAGIISMIVIRKMKPTCSRGIYLILLLLQVLYIIQNFHFTVLFIPFFYVEVGGGYCIGRLCEPQIVSFATNLAIHLFLSANLCAVFVILLFIRHQNLVNDTSWFKFSNSSKILISSLTVILCNYTPLHYVSLTSAASASVINTTMQNFRYGYDWIEEDRNFGVVSISNAEVITREAEGRHDQLSLAVLTTAYSTFVVAISVHIIKIIYAHNKLRSNVTLSLIIRQTRHSLIQIATFFTVITIPYVLFMSLLVFDFEDDSVVLIPCIFLFSLNSLLHSMLTIALSPTIKRYFENVIAAIV